MFVCVCALWNVYSSSKCVCERAWFLSGCGLWLMELLVETALGWLQLQAALVSSLTYDNAPATLTPQCCSSSVVDGCSCFFFFFFFSLLPYFAPLIRLLLSFSRSVYLAVVYINAQSAAIWRDLLSLCQIWPFADGGCWACIFPPCWLNGSSSSHHHSI